MSQGIAAVTQGMAAAEKITANIGINLSNANTPGYKAFDNFLLSETDEYNGGVLATSRTKVNVKGEITNTKNEFDYAIEGRGLLVVECNGERRYTNAGRFDVDKDGYLSSPNGCYLMGEKYNANEEQKEVIEPTAENFGKIKVPLNDYVKGEASTEVTVDIVLNAKRYETRADYDVNNDSKSMASGVKADFKREFTVFTDIGEKHSVFMAFRRTGLKEYTVEIYGKGDEVDTTAYTRTDRLIAAGKITFDDNGNKAGDVQEAVSGIQVPKNSLKIKWDNTKFIEKETTISINWSNLKMFGEQYSGNIEINGKATGALIDTSVDKNGNLVGYYTNNARKFLAAIPVVLFKDPSELQNEFGTVFSSNAKSGEPEYVIASTAGAGQIVSKSIEGSNVDSTRSMTELMKQQRFYSYNAKAYGMMNGMENELLNVIRV